MIRGAADGERMLVMDYAGRDDVDAVLERFFQAKPH